MKAREKYPTAAIAGKALRGLGYDVSSRRSLSTDPSRIEKLELRRFAQDFNRAFGGIVEPKIGSESMLEAIWEATARRGMFTFASVHKLTCCAKCHFDWEEEYVFPYLDKRARTRLAQEHARLSATGNPISDIEDHAESEMKIFREAGVPKALLNHLDAEHREVLRRLENG